ncbi:hypothetical protein Taro_048672, partial [Colocasia esculenta]|nr:hypothetical protein [Colocasia esculenta]
ETDITELEEKIERRDSKRFSEGPRNLNPFATHSLPSYTGAPSNSFASLFSRRPFLRRYLLIQAVRGASLLSLPRGFGSLADGCAVSYVAKSCLYTQFFLLGDCNNISFNVYNH